jgi:hypothetical protein
MGRVAVVAAGTGVHGRGQDEPRRVGETQRGSAQRDQAVLQWLTEHFEDVPAELGQLVEEQHAAVGQAHFPGARARPASDEAGVAHGVVRRAKGAGDAEGPIGREHAGDAVDASGLQRLVELEAGKDGGEAARQHGLAGAGGADQEDVVTTRGGDFQGALGDRLASDVGEVHRLRRPLVHQTLEIHQRGGKRRPALKEGADLSQGAGAANFQPLDDPGLGKVGERHQQAGRAGRPGRQCHGEDTADRAEVALEADLTGDHGVAQGALRQLAAGDEKAQCDRQVEG